MNRSVNADSNNYPDGVCLFFAGKGHSITGRSYRITHPQSRFTVIIICAWFTTQAAIIILLFKRRSLGMKHPDHVASQWILRQQFIAAIIRTELIPL